MMKEKTAVLLMNVGSPDKPELWAVWKYLTQFLNDRRVIDLPLILQKFLVNFIIIPFRLTNSTKLYKMLWTEKGSPLIWHSLEMKEKLQLKLGSDYEVFVAMRYQNPDYKKITGEIKSKGYKRMILFPLYPQHAMSTTETTIEAVRKELDGSDIQMNVIGQFYEHPDFIRAFATQGRKYHTGDYDHIIFSYHGLPNRHLEKSHPGIDPVTCPCSVSMPHYGQKCYRAACYATTRLLAGELGLDEGQYSVAFQSRLDKNWMEPFTDEMLLGKLEEGKKKILVFAPAFVTDCLETIIEIGEEYGEMFLEKGGEKLQLVASLNSEDHWIEVMEKLVRETEAKLYQ
jgi:protoporphyrin/coproporphyrin ferrochelatase